jgi:pyruvate,orthophosphate dikinase
MTDTQWVYLFSEVEQAEKHVGNDWEKVRELLGGKGANLAEMTRINLPVPSGFTVTTEACNAFLEAGNNFPTGMWEQELDAMKGDKTAASLAKMTDDESFVYDSYRRLVQMFGSVVLNISDVIFEDVLDEYKEQLPKSSKRSSASTKALIFRRTPMSSCVWRPRLFLSPGTVNVLSTTATQPVSRMTWAPL